MSNNPFDAIIAQAEQITAEAAARKEAEHLLRQQQLESAAKQKRQEQLIQRRTAFGEGFLHAVASRVVKLTWSPDYIRQIKEYAEALLRQTDVDLPKINERHARQILDKFGYGLSLPRNEGIVPEGFFYGQRLLAEQETSRQAEPQRIVYTDDPRPAYTSRSTDGPGSNVVDLKPATTPKTRKGRGHYRRQSATG